MECVNYLGVWVTERMHFKVNLDRMKTKVTNVVGGEASLEVRMGYEETSGKDSMQGIVCSVRDVWVECLL